VLGAVREYIEAILIAVLVFFILQISVQNFKVEGSSMHPTLEDGEYLLVNKLVYLRVDMQRLSRLIPFWEVKERRTHFVFHHPRPGEIIIFQYPLDPDRDFVKRVIAVPGQTVEVRHGVIYVDNKAMEGQYASTGNSSEYMAPKLMQTGEYFVVGDNRLHSSDSRDWGAVPQGNIIGQAWFTYWPTSHFGFFKTPAVTTSPD
jgi:signal peptidase I